MSQREFGGITVGQLNLDRPGQQLLGTGPYEYFFYQSREKEEVAFTELRSFSVYLLKKDPNAVVRVEGVGGMLEQGDCVQAEDREMRLSFQGGPVQVLLAGTVKPHPEIKGLFVTRYADLYRVSKPWGHELWINGQHPCYALKQIFVKAGTKTSLQYHHFKQETNVLFQGIAKLHYKASQAVPFDKATAADTTTVEIEPVSTVGVAPPTLHRLEAVTDILLYETSTPHLDDVVRVQDDSQRPDGRIEMEHRQ